LPVVVFYLLGRLRDAGFLINAEDFWPVVLGVV
jgi:hypothetical protein